MSDYVFPELPSQIWPVAREPVWSGLHVETTANGREFRSLASTYPRTSYTLRFAALDANRFEAQRLIDFYNSMGSGFDYFRYRDREDDRVTLQQIGVTNGATQEWQLGKAQSNLPMNLLTYSGSLDSGWTMSSLTLSQGYPSRDTLDAALLTEPSSGSVAHYINLSAITVVPGQAHTFAVKLLPNGRKRARLNVLDHVGAVSIGYADIDLMTGACLTTGDVQAAGSHRLADGMRVAWVTVAISATVASARVRINLLDESGAATYAGDGVSGMWAADAEFYPGAFVGLSQRTVGAVLPVQFLTPVFDLAGAPSIYLADTSGVTLQTSGYTVGATGLLTFTSAPASGKALLWSGGYYQRARFSEGGLSQDQFTRNLYASQSVKLITVKP